MADAPASSPGFFSSLMGGLGGLLGFKSAPPDPNAQKPDETQADYAARRRDARFGQMKTEVDGLLKKYPATEDLPANAFQEERRGLRQRGYDQKEEDAIINTFAHTFGARQGTLEAVLGRPGGEEGETQFFGEAKGGGSLGGTADIYNRANPPLPPGVKLQQGPELPADAQVMGRLMDNYYRAGRAADFMTQRQKSGKVRIIPNPSVGTSI